MKPLSLKLQNFQSHRELDLDLSTINPAVLSGPNGAGKSSLIDAIRFALFGYARGGNLDTVVTEGEQVCRVELLFELNGGAYLVSRQRSRKGSGSTTLSFQQISEGAPVGLDGKSVAETQKRIESLLRMNDGLFTATACANQGNASAFSRAKPADRKEVLGSGILDLGQWERRAEKARSLTRDLEATKSAQTTALTQAEAKAASLPQIAEALEANASHLADAITLSEAAAADLATCQTAREQLLRDQESDRARRKELSDLESRLPALSEAADAAKAALERLTKWSSAREQVEVEIAGCEKGAAEAEGMELARRELDRLDRELVVAQSAVATAKQKHSSDVKALRQSIDHAKATHAAELKRLDGQIAGLKAQTEVIERVPCTATAPGKDMAATCPLLVQAREAKERLPGLEDERNKAAAATPWTPDQEKLDNLAGQAAGPDAPWSSDEARVAEITSARAALVYDAGAHEKAKVSASKLGLWQGRLGEVRAAEEQLPAAQETFARSTSEYHAAEAHREHLAAELGAPADWAGLIAANEREASGHKSRQAEADRERTRLSQEEGSLRERLAAAQSAGEEVERLRAEIAEADRRLNLLRILGNSRDGAFSKGGIPALLIELAIPELEAAANDVLTTLSDGRMSLELRSQRETASGFAETLDIVISDERGPRLYDTFSGGEAMRVDLALRIGLSEMLARRADARCELLVLDETAAPLDQEGQEQFVAALARISDRFGLVLVVSHLLALKDKFPYRLEVSKGPDGSRVEVMAA